MYYFSSSQFFTFVEVLQKKKKKKNHIGLSPNQKQAYYYAQSTTPTSVQPLHSFQYYTILHLYQLSPTQALADLNNSTHGPYPCHSLA